MVNLKYSNKTLYTFISLMILIAVVVVVYAIPPGGTGDPGHYITDIGPPSGCIAGEFLQWAGSASGWECGECGEEPCVPDCSCASSLCVGSTCNDPNCGIACPGTLSPDCACASSTCKDTTCTDPNCGTTCTGTNSCKECKYYWEAYGDLIDEYFVMNPGGTPPGLWWVWDGWFDTSQIGETMITDGVYLYTKSTYHPPLCTFLEGMAGECGPLETFADTWEICREIL